MGKVAGASSWLTGYSDRRSLWEHQGGVATMAQRRLFPAVREAQERVVVVAPGTSCREQILDGTGRRALHPAEYLAGLLHDVQPVENELHSTLLRRMGLRDVPIKPESVYKEINEFFDEDTIFVPDIGLYEIWSGQFQKTHKPRHYLCCGQPGPLVSPCIRAKLGRPENLLEEGRLNGRLQPAGHTRSTMREEQKCLFEDSER